MDFSTGIAFSTSLDFLLSVLQEWGIFFTGMEILQALEVSATGRGITFLTFFFKKSIKKYKNKLNRSLFKYIYCLLLCIHIQKLKYLWFMYKFKCVKSEIIIFLNKDD